MSTARNKDFSELTFSEVTQYYRELRQVLYDELNGTYPWFKFSSISSSDAAQADKWRYVDNNPDRVL